MIPFLFFTDQRYEFDHVSLIPLLQIIDLLFGVLGYKC